MGHRHARQARRPRHRRRDVPPARPADVRHRRLSSGRRPGGRSRVERARDDVLEEPARAEEVRERLPVLVAGQPGLAALGGVDLRVVPQQVPHGVGLAALGRADVTVELHRRPSGGPPGRAWAAEMRGAGQPRGEAVRHLDATQTGDAALASRIIPWDWVKTKLSPPRRRVVFPQSSPSCAVSSWAPALVGRLNPSSRWSSGVGHDHGEERQEDGGGDQDPPQHAADRPRPRRRSTRAGSPSRSRSGAGAPACLCGAAASRGDAHGIGLGHASKSTSLGSQNHGPVTVRAAVDQEAS